MKNDRSDRLEKLIAVGAMVLPIIFVLILIVFCGSNAPIWDEWGIVSIYRKLCEEGLSASEFLGISITNHRCVVPIAMEFLIWKLTSGNDIVVLVVMQAFLVVALVAIARYWKSKALPLLALIPAAVPIFSMKHGLMIMWSSCMLWPCCTMFTILSLYAFYRAGKAGEKHERLWFVLSMLFGVFASFSAGNGLLLWVTYVVIFVAQALFEKKKLVTGRNVVVVLIGVLCWIEFFRGGTLAANEIYKTKGLSALIGIFVESFANPILEADAGWAAFIVGAFFIGVLFLAACWICKRKLISQYAFPISIIVFSIGSMFMVACTRGGLSPAADIAASTQYAMYPAWLYVGVIMLAAEVVLERFKIVRVDVVKSISIVLYIFLMIISVGKYGIVKSFSQRIQATAYSLQHWDEVPLKVKQDNVFPNVEFVDGELLDWVKENKLFLFAHDKQYEYPYSDYLFAEIDNDFSLPETEDETGTYFVDWVNGAALTEETITIDRQAGLNMAGWALDDEHDTTPSSVYLKIEDTFYKMKIVPRDSVVNYFGNSEYLNSGFQGYVSTSKMLPGIYDVDLIVVSSDGQSYYEEPIFTLEVTSE